MIHRYLIESRAWAVLTIALMALFMIPPALAQDAPTPPPPTEEAAATPAKAVPTVEERLADV